MEGAERPGGARRRAGEAEARRSGGCSSSLTARGTAARSRAGGSGEGSAPEGGGRDPELTELSTRLRHAARRTAQRRCACGGAGRGGAALPGGRFGSGAPLPGDGAAARGRSGTAGIGAGALPLGGGCGSERGRGRAGAGPGGPRSCLGAGGARLRAGRWALRRPVPAARTGAGPELGDGAALLPS